MQGCCTSECFLLNSLGLLCFLIDASSNVLAWSGFVSVQLPSFNYGVLQAERQSPRCNLLLANHDDTSETLCLVVSCWNQKVTQCLSWIYRCRNFSRGWDFREVWVLAWMGWIFLWEHGHNAASCKVLNQEEYILSDCCAEQCFWKTKQQRPESKPPTNNIIFIPAMAALWTENGMFCFAGLVCRMWLYPIADKKYVWPLEGGRGGWEDLCLQNHWCRKMQVLCCV